MQGRLQGVTLDYVAGWPVAHDLDGAVRADGAHLSFDIHKGRIFGAELGATRIDIADLRAANPVLRIDGSVAGQSSDFSRYVADSPLDALLERPLAGIQVDGPGRLGLKLEWPLGKPAAIKVAGDFAIDAGRIQFSDGTPPIERLAGTVLFTGREVSASGLTGELLGGPARFAVATPDGRLRVEGEGNVNLAQLRAAYPKLPLLNRISGSTDWKAVVSSQPGGMAWVLDSSLKGAVIDLPAPAGKAAGDAVELRVERRLRERSRDTLLGSYGRARQLCGRAQSCARRRHRGPCVAGARWCRRGTGSARLLDSRRRRRARRRCMALGARSQLNAGAANDDLPLSGVDVSFGALIVSGRVFKDLHIAATRAAADWQFDLRGRELTGNARWQAAASGRPNGRLVARLQQVVAPAAAPRVPSAAAPRAEAPPTANPWPALDIVADSFTIRNHELGKLELLAQPHDADWQIENLKVSNDEGTATATGWWRNTRAMQQTELDVDLNVRDAGGFLARFGVPDAVRGAPTQLRGQAGMGRQSAGFQSPDAQWRFHPRNGSGKFHAGRSWRRQAARHPVVAGDQAAARRRLPGSVRTRVRLR